MCRDPGYPPGVGAGRGSPRAAGQENSVSASSAGLSKEELCVGVFFPTKRDQAREGGKVEGNRGGGRGGGEGSEEVK